LENALDVLTEKTSIMHLIAAEVSLFDNPTLNNTDASEASTIDTLDTLSTLDNLMETNPALIVSPDEMGTTPLHIMSRNLFSGVSSLTISTDVAKSMVQSSQMSALTQSTHFEQSKKILSKMIHTALPSDADEDFLNHLFSNTFTY
jgi:hypothetical protein